MSNWLINQNRDVIIFCAGWKNRFSLEDSVLAGAIAKNVLKHPRYYTDCDSTLASIDLWTLAEPDIMAYIDKAAQRSRLRKNGLDDVIDFCHTLDLTNIIPVFSNGFLVPMVEPVVVC